MKRPILTNSILTLFSFNIMVTQDKGRGLRSEAIKGESTWVHKIVPALNSLRVLNVLLHTLFIPALKFRTSLNCAKQEVKELVARTINATKLK